MTSKVWVVPVVTAKESAVAARIINEKAHNPAFENVEVIRTYQHKKRPHKDGWKYSEPFVLLRSYLFIRVSGLEPAPDAEFVSDTMPVQIYQTLRTIPDVLGGSLRNFAHSPVSDSELRKFLGSGPVPETEYQFEITEENEEKVGVLLEIISRARRVVEQNKHSKRERNFMAIPASVYNKIRQIYRTSMNHLAKEQRIAKWIFESLPSILVAQTMGADVLVT